MARTTQGADIADNQDGSDLAKAKLKAILQTLSGEKSIPEVCQELGIGDAMFHKLRSRFLEEAVSLLEPRRPGPKPHEESPEEQELRILREKVKELSIKLECSRIQTEVALTMPHLLKRSVKKTKDHRTPKNP